MNEGQPSLVLSMVSIDRKSGLISMDFGTTVSRIALTPEMTMGHVTKFRTMVKMAFGDLRYDVEGLPFEIVASTDNVYVITDFGFQVGVLVANPEVYLAWADKLEAIALQLMKPAHAA